MRNIRFDSRSSEWAGDMTVWLRENAENNSQQLERLHRNLRRARENELTPRQKYMLELHYDQKMSVTEIARLLEVNPSTVTRTLQRARNRLHRCLQYAL